jgi:hypothetical protein
VKKRALPCVKDGCVVDEGQVAALKYAILCWRSVRRVVK